MDCETVSGYYVNFVCVCVCMYVMIVVITKAMCELLLNIITEPVLFM